MEEVTYSKAENRTLYGKEKEEKIERAIQKSVMAGYKIKDIKIDDGIIVVEISELEKEVNMNFAESVFSEHIKEILENLEWSHLYKRIKLEYEGRKIFIRAPEKLTKNMQLFFRIYPRILEKEKVRRKV